MIKYPKAYHVWYILFPYISHKNQPHVGKYTIHESFGYGCVDFDEPIVSGLEQLGFPTIWRPKDTSLLNDGTQPIFK